MTQCFALQLFIGIAVGAEGLVETRQHEQSGIDTDPCPLYSTLSPRSRISDNSESVVFSTGWNGPIDNGDDWHYFDFERVTTVVTLGGDVPSKLLCTAHAAGTRVVRGVVLDVPVTSESFAQWVNVSTKCAFDGTCDGINIVAIRHQPATIKLESYAVAFKVIRKNLPDHAQLTVTVQMIGTNNMVGLIQQLSRVCDFIVLAAYDSHVGSAEPMANIATHELDSTIGAIIASGVSAEKLVTVLPWFGWDYRCTSGTRRRSGQCHVTPPNSMATWIGWNVQRSFAFIVELAGLVQGPSTLPKSRIISGPTINEATDAVEFQYIDASGVDHVIIYDDPETLARKYQVCHKHQLKGLGVWTVDMVNYLGSDTAQQLAVAMWRTLDPQYTLTRRVFRSGVTSTHAITKLSQRFRDRMGISQSDLIPGYDPCKQKQHTGRYSSGCSNGLLCISPLPTGQDEHESGGCYPVQPSISLVASTLVPPIPPTFRPEEATVYYYLNLVMPDDGNSDVTNSTKGYGFMNQFVPQLELGEALCGSTGRTGGYQTSTCDIVDPLRQWVIQSQYFFGVLNHSGVPDPSGVSWTGHAVTGDTIPVFPGEQVVTNFTMMSNGTWLLQFYVKDPEEIRGRGNTMSLVQVDHPYMNPKFSWLHPDFNHTLAGACNEVYNLQPRVGDIARPLDMNITISQANKDDSNWRRWMADWQINEGLPQCPTGLLHINLTTSYNEQKRSQTAHLWAL